MTARFCLGFLLLWAPFVLAEELVRSTGIPDWTHLRFKEQIIDLGATVALIARPRSSPIVPGIPVEWQLAAGTPEFNAGTVPLVGGAHRYVRAGETVRISAGADHARPVVLVCEGEWPLKYQLFDTLRPTDLVPETVVAALLDLSNNAFRAGFCNPLVIERAAGRELSFTVQAARNAVWLIRVRAQLGDPRQPENPETVCAELEAATNFDFDTLEDFEEADDAQTPGDAEASQDNEEGPPLEFNLDACLKTYRVAELLQPLWLWDNTDAETNDGPRPGLRFGAGLITAIAGRTTTVPLRLGSIADFSDEMDLAIELGTEPACQFVDVVNDRVAARLQSGQTYSHEFGLRVTATDDALFEYCSITASAKGRTTGQSERVSSSFQIVDFGLVPASGGSTVTVAQEGESERINLQWHFSTDAARLRAYDVTAASPTTNLQLKACFRTDEDCTLALEDVPVESPLQMEVARGFGLDGLNQEIEILTFTEIDGRGTVASSFPMSIEVPGQSAFTAPFPISEASIVLTTEIVEEAAEPAADSLLTRLAALLAHDGADVSEYVAAQEAQLASRAATLTHADQLARDGVSVQDGLYNDYRFAVLRTLVKHPSVVATLLRESDKWSDFANSEARLTAVSAHRKFLLFDDQLPVYPMLDRVLFASMEKLVATSLVAVNRWGDVVGSTDNLNLLETLPIRALDEVYLQGGEENSQGPIFASDVTRNALFGFRTQQVALPVLNLDGELNGWLLAELYASP